MADIKKNLALLFAGALASVIGGLLFQPPFPDRYLCGLFAIVIILILYGSGAISKMSHSYNLWARNGTPKVGILSDMQWDLENKEISSWTDVSPKEWKREIERQANENKVKIKVKLINVKKNFDSYIAILNPYGGVYPECDFEKFRTLNKIFNYVNEKGIFVNVADIPGYWAYNQLLKRRLDTTPPIYDIDRTPDGKVFINPMRPFQLTPFMGKLGLQVLNIKNSELFRWDMEFDDKVNRTLKEMDEIKVHRVAIVERNIDPVMKPKKLKQIDANVTPLFFVNYGEGKFLISLLFENYCQNGKMKKVLADIITALVGEGIKKKNN